MTDDTTEATPELETELGDDEPLLDDDLLDDDEDAAGFDDEDEGEDDDDEDALAVPLDASEDGDDELADEPAVDLAAIEEGLEVDDPTQVDEDDDEDDEDDVIRAGEFVCSSCHMAKRSSALADEDEMLCRDCV